MQVRGGRDVGQEKPAGAYSKAEQNKMARTKNTPEGSGSKLGKSARLDGREGWVGRIKGNV
jgi:ribosomal protein L19E